jgi:hypothetical protein
MWIKANTLNKDYYGWAWVAEPIEKGYSKPYLEEVFWKGGEVCVDVAFGLDVPIKEGSMLWLVSEPSVIDIEIGETK